jgi:nucleotide-binding universal stress UspA family protein
MLRPLPARTTDSRHSAGAPRFVEGRSGLRQSTAPASRPPCCPGLTMFSRILIATDLSEASDQIAGNLQGLTSLGAQEVILAHATDVAPQSLASLGINYTESLRDDLLRRAQARLEKLRQVVENQGLLCSVRIVFGAAAPALASLAQEVEASLIIVGSRGASLAKNIVLGSTAMEILQESPVPVLLKRLQVKESSGQRHYRLVCRDIASHILYATDFSATADRAFHFLEKLAPAAGIITLLHVSTAGESASDFLGIQSRLNSLKLRLEVAGASQVVARNISGTADEEILRAADAPEVSLVVLGTHGKGYVEEFFMGSVSQTVARRCTIPVLLIPPGTHPSRAPNRGAKPPREEAPSA